MGCYGIWWWFIGIKPTKMGIWMGYALKTDSLLERMARLVWWIGIFHGTFHSHMDTWNPTICFGVLSHTWNPTISIYIRFMRNIHVIPLFFLVYSLTHRIHGAAIYGAPWIPSIYPLYVSIYISTMDPMGNDIALDIHVRTSDNLITIQNVENGHL